MPDSSCAHELFERLKAALLELGHSLTEAVLLTEDLFGPPTATLPPFILVVAAEFRGLLSTEPENEASSLPELTLDSKRIAAFLKILRSQAVNQPDLAAQLKRAQAIHRPPIPAPSVYATFITQLYEALVQTVERVQTPTVIACQPIVDAALEQQVQQEQLIDQVTTQIRESLELPTLLNAALGKVCACLEIDHMLLYQFEPSEEGSAPVGAVVYEFCTQSAVALMGMPRAQHWAVKLQNYQRYAQDETVFTESVLKASDLLEGPTELLYKSQVRSQLIAPLKVQDRLWGLLIAHQCSPRIWEVRDVKFVEQIAEHMALAIRQDQLYEQVHFQKQTLEQQVAQRTQDLQNALVETQSANRVKNDFLATMSHELRTPLTCVIGMSATLIRWSLGPLNDKQRGYLQTIHDSGEHLLELINDILELSHAESGKATLSLTEFSLSVLAHKCIQMLREKAEEREVILRVNIKISEGQDSFVADSSRVMQILFNLLSNAIKFTPPEGEVTLRVWMEANIAVFQVEDTGIGIPADQQSRLFQKFQQLDTSYRRTYEGTGLGLALTKQFVDLHRGWIEVQSSEGQGTTFTVEIPNHRNLTAQDDQLRSQFSKASSRIVLLEENEESATLMCEMLTAAGYHVIWIVDDSTARAQICFLQPMAVIVSVDPKTGLRQIEQFRKFSEANQRFKIVALLPNASVEDLQSYLTAGADTCLQKPLNPEHLIHKVDILLNDVLEESSAPLPLAKTQ